MNKKSLLSHKGNTYTLHKTIERVILNKDGLPVEDDDNICRHCLGTGKTNRRFMSWISTDYKTLKEMGDDANLLFYGFDISKMRKSFTKLLGKMR